MWNIFVSELGCWRYDCYKLIDDYFYNWINVWCEEEM